MIKTNHFHTLLYPPYFYVNRPHASKNRGPAGAVALGHGQLFQHRRPPQAQGLSPSQLSFVPAVHPLPRLLITVNAMVQ